MVERIVFYGMTMPISLFMVAFFFYASRELLLLHKRYDDKSRFGYDWVLMLGLGVCTFIGMVCFIIGFEYGILNN